MKKVLALVLAMVLCLGIFAGCNTDEPVDTTPSTTAPAGNDTTAAPDDTTAAVEEEYTFPAGAELHIICGHDINDLPMDKFVEGATGLSIKWTPLGTQDELTAMLTQKVTPSLLFNYGPDYGHEMGRYGAFVNLMDYKDIMPNFFARMDAYAEEGTYDDYLTSEDELYSAPVFLNGDVQHYGWFYREDIFAELNLTPPTNLEELYAVLAALKEAYPDSYPLTMRNMGGDMAAFIEFAQQFGLDYSAYNPSLARETGKFYNAYVTDEARNMLKFWRDMIDKGYMDVAALSNGTAEWVADLSSGKSFITHDKAFQLTNLERNGQEVNPDFSLKWWNNLPLAESDLPYQCRASKNYMYSWHITTKCPDIELACRYLDWMYSDEGSLVLSWGVEGESYEIDENGNKYFIEGYDATFNARYQESGYIDMKATAATYTPKCQEMIFDTMAAAAEGDFWAAPTLVFSADEQNTLSTYQVDWQTCRNTHWQNFLLGKTDINDDAAWNAFVADVANYHDAEIIAAFDAAYARYLEGEVA